MTDLNTVIIIGRLTKDCEVAQVGQAQKITFTVAVNKSIKKGDAWSDDVSYFDCIAWNKSQNTIGKLVKGAQCCISGYLKQDRWDKDGQKHSRVMINADVIQFPSVSAKGESAQVMTPSGNLDIPF